MKRFVSESLILGISTLIFSSNINLAVLNKTSNSCSTHFALFYIIGRNILCLDRLCVINSLKKTDTTDIDLDMNLIDLFMKKDQIQ